MFFFILTLSLIIHRFSVSADLSLSLRALYKYS
jgi:hypothetical protein